MSTDFPFSHRLDVRFRDCDSFGHVNNAVYFTYLEQCRLALWRQLSGSERLPGAGTILAHAECDYLAPAYVNEVIDVRVKADHVGRSSFTLVYEVANATTGQILAKARTVIVAFDYQAKKPVPISPEGRAFLARIGGQV